MTTSPFIERISIIDDGTEEMTEFVGPNYEENCYANARYRRSKRTVELEFSGRRTLVPRRLEALDRDGNWQQHPVVFMHYGSYENLKNNEGHLVVFHSDGCISSQYHDRHSHFSNGSMLETAQTRGLTEGKTSNLKLIVKEEE